MRNVTHRWGGAGENGGAPSLACEGSPTSTSRGPRALGTHAATLQAKVPSLIFYFFPSQGVRGAFSEYNSQNWDGRWRCSVILPWFVVLAPLCVEWLRLGFFLGYSFFAMDFAEDCLVA